MNRLDAYKQTLSAIDTAILRLEEQVDLYGTCSNKTYGSSLQAGVKASIDILKKQRTQVSKEFSRVVAHVIVYYGIKLSDVETEVQSLLISGDYLHPLDL